MADIRLRLFFNLATGASSARTTKRWAGIAASTIAQNIAFGYADGYRKTLVRDVQQRVRLDIRAEIANAAARYRRIVIGHERGMGAGRLDAVTEGRGAPGIVPSAGIVWKPRAPKYLARKSHQLGHTRWFDGWTRHMALTLGKGDMWTEIFGPIKVAVRQGKSPGFSRALSPNLGGRRYRPAAKEGQDPKAIRIHIGSVEVAALEKITPAMLRSYSKGGVPAAVAAAGYEELAYRLGGPPTAPYRPTLEPFLEFVLTKAIPFAVQRRVQAGLRTRIVPLSTDRRR